MNTGENLALGLDSTVVLVTIGFLVLIALCILISIQSRILRGLGAIEEKMGKSSHTTVSPDLGISNIPAAVPVAPAAKTGLAQGEARLIGVEDEELVAVIMAAVSQASNISLSDLRIRSIKRVEGNWSGVATQEMANQRL